MVIKEINIGACGKLKNKTISFRKGINILYGENEAGKSTLEEFLRMMLYGFPQRKGKEERVRYTPFEGGSIKGELILEQDGKEYIIKRTFGATRKEDTTLIIDTLTGKEALSIDKDEPGKSFLGINRQTFERTLFISQLGVGFSKGQDDEIMEKITNLFGCGEDEISFEKGILKLVSSKKELTTTRGVGTLDGLKKRKDELLQERYEGYSLSAQNLRWEEELLKEKDNRRRLNDDISSLELYKKYLKKVSLNNEYKDICQYLQKSKELKAQEEQLGSLIDEAFIHNLKDENKLYLGLLDTRASLNEEINEYKNSLEKIQTELNQYKFLDVFDGNMKEKLINLKYEQQNLIEKINSSKTLEESLRRDEEELKKLKSKYNENYYELTGLSKVEGLLESYELTLKILKEKLQSKNKQNKVRLLIIIGIMLFIGGGALTFLGSNFKLVGVLLCVISFLPIVFLYMDESKNKNEVIKLKREMKDLENQLDGIVNAVGVSEISELVAYIRSYEVFLKEKERLLLRIHEKDKMLSEEGIFQCKEKYKKNEEMITSLLRLSHSNSLEEILDKVNRYEELELEEKLLRDRLLNKEAYEKELNKDIDDKEIKLKNLLSEMNLDLGNLLDIELYIKEYKNKLKKQEEIHRNIQAVEETYKALLKDRNINEIKEELGDIIKENNRFSFEKDEDIEREEKIKSKELIQCEKNIKDLENSISNRFIGKRSLIDIEEELEKTTEDILKGDKKVKAIDIAVNEIKEAFNEIKKDLGPEMNKKILDNFKILSNNKYNEVYLGEDYEMVVRDKDNIFSGNLLSNGAKDQLYLSLRIALIDMIFKGQECPIILDDAFIQYDELRREKALELIKERLHGQVILFTCQKIEKEILDKRKVQYNLINL